MADGRDGLLCQGEDGHLGEGHIWYEVISERGGALVGGGFFWVQDSTGLCTDHMTMQVVDSIFLRRARLESGVGTKTSRSRSYELHIQLRSGSLKLTERQQQQCHQAKLPTIPTNKYYLLFRFNGQSFQPTPRSAKAIEAIYRDQDQTLF